MSKSIIPAINTHFPAYAKDYGRFREFMLAYFAQLEEDGNPIEYANTFLDNTDSTNEEARYWDSILADLAWKLGLNTKIPKRVFVTFIRDYYLSRGSKKSLVFLFRLLFGVDAQVSYPRDDMLTLDHTDYSGFMFMFFEDSIDEVMLMRLRNAALEFGLTGEGIISKSKLIVDNVVKTRGLVKMTVSTTDTFVSGESVRFTGDGVSVLLKNKPNYSIFPTDETPCFAEPSHPYSRVKKHATGSIDEIEIVDGGSGNPDKLEITASESGGFFGQATSTSGVVTKADVLSEGEGFKTIPRLICGNANLKAKSKTIGKPLIVETTEPCFNNTETKFKTKLTALFEQPKAWSVDNHLLDHDTVLQDSYYYQQFSYRVESSVSRTEYEHIVWDEVHPSGVVMLSKLNIGIKDKVKMKIRKIK